MTEVLWTNFLKALIYITPDYTIEDMREYAMAKPACKKAWSEAKKAKDEQYAAEHAAKMEDAQQAWQASGSSPSS
eukprot:4488738-Karenia_brevis.AAC.1